MERIIQIGDTPVRMRASALIPRLYRIKFNRDLVVDLAKLQKHSQAVAAAGEEFTMEDLTIFENLAWLLAKHADPDIPEIDDWLASLEGVFSIYQVMPEVFELWAANNKTTSVPRKN